MTQIELELGVQLEGLLASLEAGLPRAATRRYVGEALAAWGFVVACPAPWCSCAESAESWRVAAQLGQGLPGRVRLIARLDGAAGVAGAAVLLALGQLLARYELRHAVEIVISAGPPAPEPCPARPVPPTGRLVAAVSFTGAGGAAPLRVGASSVAPALAQGARRLLARYPAAVWAGAECAPTTRAPCLWVGGPPRPPGEEPGPATAEGAAPSPDRMREALMLGAEIVALLQAWAPGACGAPPP